MEDSLATLLGIELGLNMLWWIGETSFGII